MKSSLFDRVVAFLQRLDEAKVAYALKHSRPEAITVNVDIPGERWEIDFLADGEVDVERFVSDGDIRDEKVLEELFDQTLAMDAGGKKRNNDALAQTTTPSPSISTSK